MGNYPVTYNQPDKFSLDRETREVQRWKSYANRNYMANLVLIYIARKPLTKLSTSKQIDALAEIETSAPSDIITSQILSLTDSQHSVKFLKLWTVARQKNYTENNNFTGATSRTNPKNFFCTTQDWIKLLTLKQLATHPPHNHYMYAWWWTQIEMKIISQTKTKSQGESTKDQQVVQIARYFTDSELSCCNHVEKYNMRNIKKMQLARVTEANYG